MHELMNENNLTIGAGGSASSNNPIASSTAQTEAYRLGLMHATFMLQQSLLGLSPAPKSASPAAELQHEHAAEPEAEAQMEHEPAEEAPGMEAPVLPPPAVLSAPTPQAARPAPYVAPPAVSVLNFRPNHEEPEPSCNSEDSHPHKF